MYQRDYIMKLIEQTARVVMKVLHKQALSFHERMELLNHALRQLVGLDSKLLQALSVKDLLVLLSPGGHPDIGKALAASDLLLARVKVLQQEGQIQAGKAEALKWLELLLTIRKMEESADLREETERRIETSLELIGRSGMETSQLELLVPYYDETGRLAKAEDALFHWIDEVKGDAWNERLSRVLDIGMEMYERWLTDSTLQLEDGGLSREEVRQGMAELAKFKSGARREEANDG